MISLVAIVLVLLVILVGGLYMVIPSLFLCKVKVRVVNGGNLDDVIPIVRGRLFFGNLLELMKLNHEQFFSYLRNTAKQMQKSYLLYVFNYPILNIIDPIYAEQILTSPLAARKSFLYRPIKDFIRSGLLTSHGTRWHTRRKLITPTFHFSILKQFFEVFKEESEKLINRVETKYLNTVVSLEDIVPRFTLDTICETAMGVQLASNNNGDAYRFNINKLQNHLVNRCLNPWYYNDIIYNRSVEKKSCDHYLEKVHQFSSTIISRRRLDITNQNFEGAEKSGFDAENVKKRNAMLDTLLLAQMHGHDITHAHICEEVDTFMFEGYETTSIALTFCLFMLAVHQDVQEMVFEEINSVSENIKNLSIADYSHFKYLECVIKETIRLYPSVPLISRGLFEDFRLGDIILPKYSMINIHIFDLHRDPKYFPDPERFDPNRFSYENAKDRNPFVYIPFSAGMRNCIGQKFAMLEMKVFLVNTIKQFLILPVTEESDIKFKIGLTLTSTEPIQVSFRRRL